MIIAKTVSSLEKCFSCQSIADFPQLSRLSILRGERFSFQIIARCESSEERSTAVVRAKVKCSAAKSVWLRKVCSVPVDLPCFPEQADDNYLGTTPGAYPDLLAPLHGGLISVCSHELSAIWVTADTDENVCGAQKAEITLYDENNNAVYSHTIELDIIDATLPEDTLKVTQWFHGDGIAHYYGCRVFSRKWWDIVCDFVKTAVRNGQNMLLTPVFTPPLDTYVGGERTTVQLVDVTVTGGKYSFSYKNLDKWVNMCERLGIRYYEISHLFTQWGAAHAPKIVATVNGRKKRIFGWETDASGEDYTRFLHAFIPDFLQHMKQLGVMQRCYFHISDEPNQDNIDRYTKSKAVVSELLRDYPIMDALSDITFYEKGVVTTPIVATNHIEPFIDAKVPGLWAYYCCGQGKDVSNRFIAMPSYRTRSMGYQMFKYDIAGFLQWGYNFYNSHHSLYPLNPYLDTSAGFAFPSGDSFSVYPAPSGGAYESLRLVVFHEALQDRRALALCADLIGKESTVKAAEEVLGEITFDKCAHSADEILTMREKINSLIAEAVGKTNS